MDATASGPWPARSATRWRRPSAAPGLPSRHGRSPNGCRRSRSSPAGSRRRPGGDAWAIGTEAKRLIELDTIRVYRVDHATAMCEPVAFEGTFLGTTEPDTATLRTAIRVGITGGSRARDAVRLGNAGPRPTGRAPSAIAASPRIDARRADDPRGSSRCGEIVVSALGRDPFRRGRRGHAVDFGRPPRRGSSTPPTTASERLHHQRGPSSERRLEGQRRLLKVERSSSSPRSMGPGSQDLITKLASFKAIVPYDSLTIYPGRSGGGHSPRGVDVARDLLRRPESTMRARWGSASPAGVMDHAEPGLRERGGRGVRCRARRSTRGRRRRPPAGPWRHHRHAEHQPGRERRGPLHGQRVREDKAVQARPRSRCRTPRRAGEVRIRAEQDALTGLREQQPPFSARTADIRPGPPSLRRADARPRCLGADSTTRTRSPGW